MGEISEESQLHVMAYLRFAHMKRQQQLKEFDFAMDEISDYGLEEAVFTRADVEALLDNVKVQLRQTVDKELEHSYHISGLLLRQLLLEAESQGTNLCPDTGSLENQYLLQEISVAEKTAISKPMSAFSRKPGMRLNSLERVPTGPSSHGAATLHDTISERDELRGLVAKQRTKILALESLSKQQKDVDESRSMRQSEHVASELQGMRDQIDAVKEAARASDGRKQKVIEAQEAELVKLRDSLEERERQLRKEREVSHNQKKMAREGEENEMKTLQERLRVTTLERDRSQGEADDLQKGLLQSKQMQQMKRLMQQKTKQIVELKKRLQRHEPEHVRSAD